MSLQNILYLLILIITLYILFFIYFRIFTWIYNTENSLKKVLKKAQKKKHICNGRIILPSNENLKKFRINKESQTVFEIFFARTFYRIIACENTNSVQLVSVRYHLILEIKIKKIENKERSFNDLFGGNKYF